MPKISLDLETSIRNALVQAIVTEPNATIADLLALAAGEHAPLLRSITLGDLVNAAGGTRAKPGKTLGKPSGAVKTNVNTRTAEGRAAFDTSIVNALEELGGGPTSGAEIKAKVGGSTLQVRTALNRLIEAGAVTFEGKARGTKYSLAKAKAKVK